MILFRIRIYLTVQVQKNKQNMLWYLLGKKQLEGKPKLIINDKKINKNTVRGEMYDLFRDINDF